MWARLWGFVSLINVKLSTNLEEKYSTKVLATFLGLIKSISLMPPAKVELLGLSTILAWYSHQFLEQFFSQLLLLLFEVFTCIWHSDFWYLFLYVISQIVLRKLYLWGTKRRYTSKSLFLIDSLQSEFGFLGLARGCSWISQLLTMSDGCVPSAPMSIRCFNIHPPQRQSDI